MLTTGRSIARIAAPYFALAVLLIPFSAYLHGQVQPVTRYGYRLAVYDAMQTGWNAKVEENRFIDAGKGATFSAREVDADGSHLRGVFVERRSPGGGIEITTAVDGQFVPGPGGHGISLQLEHGMRLLEGADRSVSIERFDHSRIDRNLLPARQPFRERGESVRERTQPELWSDIRHGGDIKAAAEFHGRLARVMILPLLPLMALPLGMASKRGQRAPGVVFATLALILVNHALQFGESLAANGRAPAGPRRLDAVRPVRRARPVDLPRQPGLARRQPGAARGGRGRRPVRRPAAAALGEGVQARCMPSMLPSYFPPPRRRPDPGPAGGADGAAADARAARHDDRGAQARPGPRRPALLRRAAHAGRGGADAAARGPARNDDGDALDGAQPRDHDRALRRGQPAAHLRLPAAGRAGPGGAAVRDRRAGAAADREHAQGLVERERPGRRGVDPALGQHRSRPGLDRQRQPRRHAPARPAPVRCATPPA